MRVLALDIGERRVGVAISDPAAKVASPLVVLDAAAVVSGGALASLLEEWEVGLIVVGLPLTMRGEEGKQARRVREVADGLAERVDVPIMLYDERLSSAEAERAMRAAGVTEKKSRGSLDKVAAAIFLQSFLDSGAHERDDGQGGGFDGTERP